MMESESSRSARSGYVSWGINREKGSTPVMYAPVMKAAEVRLFLAISAKHRLNLFKSDTKQAFLNGDIS